MDAHLFHDKDVIRDSEKRNIISFWPYALSVAICSFVAYFFTAYRTITWWDNSESVLAAATGGVPHPPGALLPTVLGWLVTRVTPGLGVAFMLNLFAGIVSALCAALLCLVTLKLLKLSGKLIPDTNMYWPMAFGASIGILTLAYGETIWQYSTRFTPYIFTAFMTAAILWAFLNWWRSAENDKSYRWLFIIALLLGLDFSVHRTNVLLWPALPLWILLRNRRTFFSAKSWVAGFAGLVLGLAFHLLIIPMAAMKPFLNANDPSNLSRFWDYISLKQYGGGWLINFFPRKAAFWNVQILDYLRVFASNFFSTAGSMGILGILPAIAGLSGIIILWRKNWRLASGHVILFLFASLGAIIYFNLPENYFRPIDRHYMPSFIIFGCWMAIGLAFMLDLIERFFRKPILPIVIILLIIVLLPGFQIIKNYHRNDGSHSFFTYDFSRNLMSTLPQKAIIFTNGDNDTYPLWYLQAVEKYRRDVTVINISLMNTPWFVSQLISRDPKLPLALTADEIKNLSPRAWTDTTIFVSAQCDPTALDIASNGAIPDTLSFHVPPSIAGKYLLPQDWLLLQIITNNAWKRPIYFAITVSPQNISWLNDYLRLEGLAQRLIPVKSPSLNSAVLRNNLSEKYNYRGYADNDIVIDDFSRMMATNYYASAIQLAATENNAGDSQACKKILDDIMTKLPLNRLEPVPEDLRQGLDKLCTSDSAR
jgi:hypothetical protein